MEFQDFENVGKDIVLLRAKGYQAYTKHINAGTGCTLEIFEKLKAFKLILEKLLMFNKGA